MKKGDEKNQFSPVVSLLNCYKLQSNECHEIYGIFCLFLDEN